MINIGERQGRIFDIERFGVVDGPGIRTVIFIKGCPLKCQWCHNPESQSMEKEIIFSEELCIKCMECEKVCKDRAIVFKKTNSKTIREYIAKKCTLCRKCIEVCPKKAIEIVGYDISAKLLVKEIIKNSAFFRRSGGGVTLSGGEPLAQLKFCKSVLRLCREEGIHTAIDTSGYRKWENISEILPLTDLFLYDVKHINNKKHQEHTGISNYLILDNLKKLVVAKKNIPFEIVVRIPVIPGFNATKGELFDILSFIKELKAIDSVEILPFHKYGASKYKKLFRMWETTGGVDKVSPELLKEIEKEGKRIGLKLIFGS